MKTRPIAMRAEEVRAILDGRKSQFRRPVNPQSIFEGKDGIIKRFPNQQGCPFGTVGDRLWVKETFAKTNYDDYLYKSTDEHKLLGSYTFREAWRSSVHLPRSASRITLEIINVRVERVQQITAQDATSEGFLGLHHKNPLLDDLAESVFNFRSAWDEIYWMKELGWDRNPWVWVCSFKRVNG